MAVQPGFVPTCLSQSKDSGGLRLHASRAVLHLSIVPEPGFATAGIPGPGLPPGVRSLGFLGRTIGGSFAIEWDESPFGPYMEARMIRMFGTIFQNIRKQSSRADASTLAGWASQQSGAGCWRLGCVGLPRMG